MKIDIVRNPRGYVSRGQIERAFSLGMGLAKQVCGICNNATYLVMQEAFKRIQSHPNYKGKAKRLFLEAMKAWRVYESSLLHPSTV